MTVVAFPVASPAECASLVAQAEGRVAPLPGRRSEQGWSWTLDELDPVAEKAMYALAEVNAGRWQFAVHTIRFSVIRYGSGQRMGRHTDEYHPDGEKRLLSCSVQLSAGADYEGGDLRLGQFLDVVASRDAGTAVAFPACVPHEVAEVTAGTRWSLVGWAYGDAVDGLHSE